MDNDTKATNEESSRIPASSGSHLHVPSASTNKAFCGCRENGRNLIICIDGTTNKFGDKNTNVIELYNLVKKDPESNQHTWYNSGIGTFARRHGTKRPSYYLQVLSHTVDAGLALNVEKTVQMAYRWLSDHYEDGDRIFLFGFSRGAYQVRLLSGMVNKVGLIFKGNQSQIPFAYELYQQSESEPQDDKFATAEIGTGLKTSDAARFKEAFCRNVKIHFVGVWDTVSSVGLRREKMSPGITDGMVHVCYFRHALALDERRVKFLPEYAHGGYGLPPHRINQKHKDKGPPRTLEVWFAGTHSDIGGGREYNKEMDRSTPPLRWMALEAAEVGLRIKELRRQRISEEQINSKESLTGLWHLFELMPFQRLAFKGLGTREVTLRPHLWAGRQMQKGQKVHCSFFLGNREGKRNYTPKAHPPTETGGASSFTWAELDKGLQVELGQETWLADNVDYFRARFEHSKPGDFAKRFRELIDKVSVETDTAKAQIVYNELIYVLQHKQLETDDKYQLLQTAVHSDPLDRRKEYFSRLELVESRRVRGRLGDLGSHKEDENESGKALAEKFIAELTDNFCLLTLEDRNWYQARSVAASSDDNLKIVCGFADDKIRWWNAKNMVKQLDNDLDSDQPNQYNFQTWDAAKRPWYSRRLQEHKETVISVAISDDGNRVVSASRDKTIRIWDTATGRQLRALEEPAVALSIAISHDSQRVVSGCEDGVVWIWNMATGERVNDLRGHSDRVRSVVFSRDGKYIVSGSNDMTIRIWELETRSTVKILSTTEQKSAVRCVAITDDGRFIVSGSVNGWLRVWEAETGKMLKDWKGHTSRLLCVAISPDGKYVVSGSEDCSIRIWDLEKGEKVGEPLQRHTKSVRSVAILPGSKLRIISGSDDNTILIWDMEEVLQRARKATLL